MHAALSAFVPWNVSLGRSWRFGIWSLELWYGILMTRLMKSLRHYYVGEWFAENRETTCAGLERVGAAMVHPTATYLYKGDDPFWKEALVPLMDLRIRVRQPLDMRPLRQRRRLERELERQCKRQCRLSSLGHFSRTDSGPDAGTFVCRAFIHPPSCLPVSST